jgi:hypothetical protein
MPFPILGAMALAAGAKAGSQYLSSMNEEQRARKLAQGDLSAYQQATPMIQSAYDAQQTMWSPYTQNAGSDMEAYRNATNDPYWNQDPERFQFDKTVEDYIDPALEYRIQQGVRGLDASASAQGGLFSSGHGRDVMSYGQEEASKEKVLAGQRFSQERGQAYQEHADFLANQQARRQGRLNASQGLANMGMQGVQNLSAQRGNYDTSMINNTTDIARAKSAISASRQSPFQRIAGLGLGLLSGGANMYSNYLQAAPGSAMANEQLANKVGG